MTCEARRLLFDYYREKPRKPCPVRLPSFFLKMPEICATPIKPLRRRAFRLDGLITPTLKAAGSNPVGRTKKSVKSHDFTDFLCEIDSALNIFLPMIFTTFRCTWMARFLKSMSDRFRGCSSRIRRYDQLLPAALRGAIGFLLVM